MNEDVPLAALLMPILIKPILEKTKQSFKTKLLNFSSKLNHGRLFLKFTLVYFFKLERKENAAAQILQTSLERTDKNSPGFLLELVRVLLHKTQCEDQVNLTETLLRLQGNLADSEPELRVNRPEEIYLELNRRTIYLKKVLSRVPDQIRDRPSFLDTIKDIASAIKKLLDAVNGITTSAPHRKHALEQRRREFVKYSKRFSNILKEYFKEGEVEPVYVAGLFLIYQTNLVIQCTKREFERPSTHENAITLRN